MSAEKIIERIKNDAEKQIQQIKDETEQHSKMIIKTAKAEAQQEAEKILQSGQRESESAKKILISKAMQDVRRDMMNAKEEIITQCFSEALQKLGSLPDDQYRKLVISLIRAGKKRLGDHCTVSVSRAIDKEIAKQEAVSVQGTVKSTGGIVLQSANGAITIDNTFERLLDRKKDEIRIHVGKLLFPS
jgi:V/A-type H+/Na+-transporting ATPase subunit E